MPKLGSYIKSVLTTLVAKCFGKPADLHPEELPGHARASSIKSVLTTLVAKRLGKTTDLHPEELPGHAQARWLHQECSNYFGCEMFR